MASVDDVFNLLNAVNRETLKRMEDKNGRHSRTCGPGSTQSWATYVPICRR